MDFDLAANIAQITSAVGNPALDIVIIVFFLAAGFIAGSFQGRNKLISFALANYITLALQPIIIGLLNAYGLLFTLYRDLSIYLLMLIVVYMVLERTIFEHVRLNVLSWWKSFITSFSVVGFFVAGLLNIMSFRGIIELSPITISLFAGPTAYLFWALVPLAAFAYIAPKHY
ncbi:MAG: hypothetical protein O2794_01160 [bacterium]|nr:hypothetical protein [bacterium]